MVKSKKRETRPYDKCLTCKYLGNGCDGPRTSSMSLERWCEWLRDVKKVKGFTNAEISELACVSLSTIERVMSGNLEKDIMRSTSTAIENATIGSNGQYPCYLAFLDEMPSNTKKVMEVEAELAQLRQNIKYLHESYNIELDKVRDGYRRQIDYLVKDIARKDELIDKLLSR